MVREMGVEFAWHTGSVPQDRRRAEINRFKKDPACRLLLSSETGGLGLNLQVADTVINLDLPWNPAKLEQRIARAWRKNQTRPVGVVNLVSEDSIEHRMLYLLDQKQGLADGVLDGRGDVKGLRMPTGRAAFLERMEAMMKGAEEKPDDALDRCRRLGDDLLARHGDALLLIEARQDASGRFSVLAVLDGDPAAARRESKRLAAASGAPAEVVDRATFETLRRLERAGVIRFTGDGARQVHRSPALDEDTTRRHLERARPLCDAAERKLGMASLLAGGGFTAESTAPVSEAAALALRCIAVASGEDDPGEAIADLPERLAGAGMVEAAALSGAARLLDAAPHAGNGAESAACIASARELVVQVRAALDGIGDRPRGVAPRSAPMALPSRGATPRASRRPSVRAIVGALGTTP